MQITALPWVCCLLLLTDGKEERTAGVPQSEMGLDELMQKLGKFCIPVCAIGLGTGVDRQVLDSVAEVSHGAASCAEQTDAVGRTYQELLAYLRSLRRFWYISRNGAHDGSQRSVEIGIARTT